jgi:hypothetical protein
MLINDPRERFDLERSIACLMLGKAGLGQEEEEEVATKKLKQ